MIDVLYAVEKDCPLCQKKFTTTKVRSRLVKTGQDSDFCTYYKDVNPYYYDIWVCPHCGYAAQENCFNEVAPAASEILKKFLDKRSVRINFGGPRTGEQAIAVYKLAIFFAELTSAKASYLAGLHLKLAWLYREAENTEEEQKALGRAFTFYEAAMSKERFPIGGLTEAAADYLMGEILRRTGRAEQALLYYNKVVSNRQARLEKQIYEMAKEAWQQVRNTQTTAK